MLAVKLTQCLAPHPPRAERGEVRKSASLFQPSDNLVELVEIAVADMHGAAGAAVVDVDRQPKRVADPLLQRDRIGILQLAAARLLRLALGHALDMRQRLGLANIEAFL